jgi:hypothetical protein
MLVKLAKSSFLRQFLLTVGFPPARLPAFFMAASRGGVAKGVALVVEYT